MARLEHHTSLTDSERARLLDRVVGSEGILAAYARDLAKVRRQVPERKLENREMLRQVRALQEKPTSARRRALR